MRACTVQHRLTEILQEAELLTICWSLTVKDACENPRMNDSNLTHPLPTGPGINIDGFN